MATSKIVDELLSRPRSEIESDLARVFDERQRLQREEQFLQGILNLFDVKASAQAQEHAQADLALSAGEHVILVDVKKPAKKATAKDHILAVMCPSGYEPWPIPRVIAAVQERDPDVQPPAIRLALRRLHDDGVLMRDSHKNYRLEPTHNEQRRFSITSGSATIRGGS